VNVYYTAAVWVGMALVASLVSIRLGISVAGTSPATTGSSCRPTSPARLVGPPAISPQGGTPPRAIMRGAL